MGPARKTWDDNIFRLSEILRSEPKVKDISKFWNSNTEEVSRKCWVPRKKKSLTEKTIISDTKTSKDYQMGNSWFSLNRKLGNQGDFPEDTSQSNYKGEEMKQYEAGCVNLKTMKFRIHPSPKERKELDLIFQQFRWYYNLLIKVVYLELYDEETKYFRKSKYSYIEIRNLLRLYEYKEKRESEDLEIKSLVRVKGSKTYPTPHWWKDEKGKSLVHSRIPRGAAKKLSQNLNSALSNLKAGNIKTFVLRPLDKKSNNFALFEDKQFPAFIKKIPSVYQYRGENKLRISYQELKSTRGLELYWERDSKKYYILAPVEVDYFPPGDRRNESLKIFTEEVVALDPGMRKFLVGYSPQGSLDVIGNGAAEALFQSLRKIDGIKPQDPKARRKWKQVKGRISDLHWKSAKFLTDNYDVILLPEFRVSSMIRRGKTLCRKVRRLLSMLSFYKFREKLEFKCKEKGKRLFIVSEAYTSKTCSGCGNIQNIGSKETYDCPCCGLSLDRDANGAKNIFLRNFEGNL